MHSDFHLFVLGKKHLDCNRHWQDMSCQLLVTDMLHWSLPSQVKNLFATLWQMLKFQWWHMEAWLIPSAAHVPCIHQSQIKVFRITGFVTLLFSHSFVDFEIYSSGFIMSLISIFQCGHQLLFCNNCKGIQNFNLRI